MPTFRARRVAGEPGTWSGAPAPAPLCAIRADGATAGGRTRVPGAQPFGSSSRPSNRRWVTIADVVAATPFPVYGLVEEPADGFSFGWLDDGQVTSVGLRYESAGVELRTTTGSPSDGPVERARNALRNAVELEARDRDETLSVQARALRHSVQTRAIRARLGATPLDRVTISVDGRPTDFERHRDGSIEAAAAELDGVTVVIVSRKRPLAELALKRL
jgi:hypothetical protein